ncbi:MAG: HAMP domain-containing protein [Pirellulaceae bacterium]|nr:HAMP domain-containing protein [Pirellulaceae bacterium]
MTWLFIRFYLCVLVVLALAWYIHSSVLKSRADAEWERVIVAAHAGGARLAASELTASPPETREQTLSRLREQFDYPIDAVSLAELPAAVRRQIFAGDDVACYRVDERYCVVAALSEDDQVVRLGPFPRYDLREIEEAIGGWMRLVADKLNAAAIDKRQALLDEVNARFNLPVDIARRDELPDWPRGRIARGEDIVFYSPDAQLDDQWFAAAPLSDEAELVRFGPFPNFERVEQKAATTTLALVLLPTALAIALLLRPVAGQLRHVERAAKEIASGNLGARVDERRVRSAKPLAQSFNHMASRTEALIRTQRELLQAVSHELRTPLSRMRFAIELIETAKDDGQRKRRLEELDAATEDLDELVGELLTYVRMETLQPQLNMELISLRDMFDVLIPKYAALHPPVHFELSEMVSSSGDAIFADRTGFQRAMGNLLSNAGRHAKSQVTVSAACGNEFVTVDVDDDGQGIPECDRERVFEPFQRLDDGTNGHGVGLGLALVKRVVTQHGGVVEVLASPSGGCRVRTTWPLPRSRKA